MDTKSLNEFLIKKIPDAVNEASKAFIDSIVLIDSIMFYEMYFWSYIEDALENKDYKKLKLIVETINEILSFNDAFADDVIEDAIICKLGKNKYKKAFYELLSFKGKHIFERYYKPRQVRRKFEQNLLNHKTSIILPTLLNKKVKLLQYSDCSNNEIIFLLAAGNKVYKILNIFNPLFINGDFGLDSRILSLEEINSEHTKNAKTFLNFDKKIIDIKIIVNTIFPCEGQKLINQNGLLVAFDDNTNIVLHCPLSKNKLNIYLSKEDYENKVKVNNEFDKTIKYSKKGIKSKFERVYISIPKHIVYNSEDIDSIDKNEEVIMYRATPSGGMGACGSAEIIFKSKNILNYYFGDDFDKLKKLSEIVSSHIKEPNDFIDVDCGFQNCISIKKDYFQIFENIININIVPRRRNLMHLNCLIDEIDNVDFSKKISLENIGIKTKFVMGDSVKTLVDKKFKFFDKQIFVPKGRTGDICEVNIDPNGKYYAVVEICRIPNVIETTEIFEYYFDEIDFD